MTSPRYNIVGSNFVSADELIKALKGGEKLSLVRQPDHEHDKNAVAVFFEGRPIGYVPKTHNVTLAKFIDQNGEPFVPAEDLVLAQDKKPGMAIGAVFIRSANSGFPQAEVAT